MKQSQWLKLWDNDISESIKIKKNIFVDLKNTWQIFQQRSVYSYIRLQQTYIVWWKHAHTTFKVLIFFSWMTFERSIEKALFIYYFIVTDIVHANIYIQSKTNNINKTCFFKFNKCLQHIVIADLFMCVYSSDNWGPLWPFSV